MLHCACCVIACVLHGVTECLLHSVTGCLWNNVTKCQLHIVTMSQQHNDIESHLHCVAAAQQYGELAAWYPLCSNLKCTRVNALPLYSVLVHGGRSLPSLPGTNESNTARGRQSLGTWNPQFVEGFGRGQGRTRSTPRDERGLTLRCKGLASPRGKSGKVRRGLGVCISNGKAGPSAELSGMPSLRPSLPPSLPLC